MFTEVMFLIFISRPFLQDGQLAIAFEENFEDKKN